MNIKDAIVNGVLRVVEKIIATEVSVTDELTIPTSAPSSPQNGDIYVG